MAMAFEYGKTQLRKKAYNLFLSIREPNDIMKDSNEFGFMRKFSPSDSILAVGGYVSIKNDSPAVVVFDNSLETDVVIDTTDEKIRYLVNVGSGALAVELVGGYVAIVEQFFCLGLTSEEDYAVCSYIPIGYCESGISFNINQVDSTKASTGQEFVTSENIEINANIYGLDDYIRTLLNTSQIPASIGMVEKDGSAIFVKNIVPFADITAISNDQNMTKITIKKENPVIEVI